MTQDEKQKALNLEVGQGMFQKFKDDHIGIPNISNAVYYTQAEADAYNAELTGALNSTDPLTAEEAAAYNEAVTGATKEAGDTLSSAEAAAYNATLEGAVSTSDIKTPAVPKKVKDYVDDELSGKAPNDVFGASGTNHKKGLVPDPGATAGTNKYLREDGTWQTIDMSAKADKIASEPFSDEKSYASGDYVTQGGRLWKFNTAHAAGAWTGTDADDVTDDIMVIGADGNIKDSGKKLSDLRPTYAQVTGKSYYSMTI